MLTGNDVSIDADAMVLNEVSSSFVFAGGTKEEQGEHAGGGRKSSGLS
jgi:hypothetical protein